MKKKSLSSAPRRNKRCSPTRQAWSILLLLPLIGELEEMTPDDELYDAKFIVLGEYINHHITEEEKELFPQAKRAKVDMQAIGQQLQQEKTRDLEKNDRP